MKNAVAMPRLGWWEATVGFFYPNLCQICRERPATKEDGYVCSSCRGRPGAIRFIERPFCDRCGLPFDGEVTQSFQCSNCRELNFAFTYARAAVAARGLVLDVIHRYKYSRALWFEPFLAHLLVDRAGPLLKSSQWDWIVPIPLHPQKEREREFNQAERLARHLGAATGLAVDTRILRRVLPTPTQTLLSRKERELNVSRAFAVRPGRRLQGQRIVLVDDVFTTGATSNACAKALRRNGSGEVCVWTVARGL